MDESTILQTNSKELDKQDELVAKSGKKTKVTFYLTEEAEHAFAELYIARYRKDRKIDRSTIACEAILAFYKNECSDFTSESS